MKKTGIDILEDLIYGTSSIEKTSHNMHDEDRKCTQNKNAVDEFLLRVENNYKKNSWWYR